MTALTLSAALQELRSRFGKAGIAEPAADARVLIAGLLDVSPTAFLSSPERPLTPDEAERIEAAALRRIAREPVHRILGHREFHGLQFLLSKGTLEPRPDTEILVDTCLPHLHRIVAVKGEASLVDLGTGTGAIALALLASIPQAVATGADISPDALETARQNAINLGLEARFKAVKSNWTDAITDLHDLVVSNPPYIASAVVAALEPEVRDHDPAAALDGGEDGLEAYRALALCVPGILAAGGILALEIGYDQKDSVTHIFRAAGFRLEQAVKDYGDNDRVLVFSRDA